MRIALCVLLAGAFLAITPAQQMADPDFHAGVAHPAYTDHHPVLLIDQAHNNFHTAEGRYKPFADLLRSDGYDVREGKDKFSSKSLRGVDVLVIANALGEDATDTSSGPAFTPPECDEVRDWVRGGGALLLISDHTPFGAAADDLAREFGVEMGKGFVMDPAHSQGNLTFLVYSRENGLLGDHPITRGRSDTEKVDRVVAFTGQSLSVPQGAAVLMRIADGAYEAPSRKDVQAAGAGLNGSGPHEPLAQHGKPAGGRAQGLAMHFGKGRVAMFGEAAMFSAQLIKSPNGGEVRFGMNLPGTDDRQFLLNTLHWLSGALK